MIKAPAKFITLEGSEGTGKSTCLDVVRDYLESHGLNPLLTREPGGTPLGERIRAILLQADLKDKIGADSELLLMFAARAQHVQDVIRPALNAGRWVVSDRFSDASYAYQGAARGLGMARVAMLEEWVLGGFRPDLTLLLDAPVAVGLARAAQRSVKDRFEQEEAAFFQRVRDAYLQRAQADPARCRVVRTDCELPQVKQRIEAILQQFLNDIKH